MAKKTIALVHTTRLVIDRVQAAVAKEFPDYKLIHILDETLLEDFAKTGGTNARVRRRLLSMVTSAEESGAALILVTCSSLGDTVYEVQKFVDVPILKVDQPMAEEVVGRCDKVGVLATAKSAACGTIGLLKQEAQKQGREVTFQEYICPDASLHFSKGMDDYNKYLSDEACKLGAEVDAVVVSQVSMCGLEGFLEGGRADAIFTALPFAIKKMREILG